MDDKRKFLELAYSKIRDAVAIPPSVDYVPTLPSQEQLALAKQSIPGSSAKTDATGLRGQGSAATLNHLVNDLAPALTGQNRSGRYYGFVTGSTLPIAEAADNLVSAFDQNVQVHLPGETIATYVEDAALKMLMELLDLDLQKWSGRTFTTGATASNILGLACGREWVVQQRLIRMGIAASAGEDGLLSACTQAGIRGIQILTTLPHSSLSKAASIVGLGRASVKVLPSNTEEPWVLDLEKVTEELQRTDVLSIIAISAGDVNTGQYSIGVRDQWERLAAAAEKYGAWIHVDGAFGIFARALPSHPEFSLLRDHVAGLEFAHSIGFDSHKLLNVPYDCGVFLCRHADPSHSTYSVLNEVCRNQNAAYLDTTAADLASPLNSGLENSRRFRALPVYAVLLSEGRAGIQAMLTRMVRLAQVVAKMINLLDDYVLLPETGVPIFMVVLFRAKDDDLNAHLVDSINKRRKIYVSATHWNAMHAVRMAISSYMVDEDKDLQLIETTLKEIAQEHRSQKALRPHDLP